MEQLQSLLESVNMDPQQFLTAGLYLTIGCIVLGFLGRYVFGSGSVLGRSVSSAIGILFVYAATVTVYSLWNQYEAYLPPLPFVEIDGSTMTVFSFEGAEFATICTQLLRMVILAFLANLIDSLLPPGQNIFTWLIFRVLTIVLAMGGQLLITWLMTAYLPQDLVTYAPTVLLGILVLMLAVGAFKILVGALIATVNPLIGALYTFFFASVIGKALSTAVFTTAILSGLIYGLNCLGFTAVAIGSAALIGYIPLAVALLVIWRLVVRPR